MRKPKHIAFIMDGNNRWSVANNLHFSEGHKKGLQILEKILDSCFQIGITVVTLYAFSIENWKRSAEEKKILFDLLFYYFKKKINKIIERETKIKILGDISKFPPEIIKILQECQFKSKDKNKFLLQIAIGYGGRDEIMRAVKKIAQKVLDKKIKPQEINHDFFIKFLDTGDTIDPDLLIRTSGEYRISNFLPYQMAYTEFFFTPTLWPDFTSQELYKAIDDFSKRERRYGGRL
jgi:undecaprenyl diphosphate synthase